MMLGLLATAPTFPSSNAQAPDVAGMPWHWAILYVTVPIFVIAVIIAIVGTVMERSATRHKIVSTPGTDVNMFGFILAVIAAFASFALPAWLNMAETEAAQTKADNAYAASQVSAVRSWLLDDYGIHADASWTKKLLAGDKVGAVVNGNQVTISTITLPGNHIGLIDENKRPLATIGDVK